MQAGVQMRERDEIQEMPRLFQKVPLLGSYRLDVEEIGKQPLALLLLAADHQVFQNRHFRKWLRDLEGPRQPMADALFRALADTSRPEIHNSPEVG